MISTLALIATGLLCIVIGACLGALVMRAAQKKQQPQDLQSQYTTLQDEYTQYQQNVSQHFIDTSRLILESQQRQQQLREHLVSGALHLTSADVSRAILAEGDAAEDDTSTAPALENIDPASINPPKDWAPKTPGQEGVLSEGFGLNEEQEDTNAIEVKTAKANIPSDSDKPTA